MSKIEHDDITGTETTGHEWDGIKELNTPLPRWWLYTFYATVAWAAVYTVLYPAWPLLNGATPGILGYSSRAAVSESIAQARAAQGEQLQKIAAASVEDILKDPALLEFARAGGAAAFKVNCVQCHGSGAAGSAGYPNLNDDDWLWGGTPDQIHTTLRNGIRYTLNGETRDSQMPAFGADGILTPEQIADVANYTHTLSGGQADAAAAERGRQLFVDNCASCHGEDGKGLTDFGSPNLTDGIWLFGDGLEAITAQIHKPRQGVMPAWAGRLDDATVKQLAVYVHSLGGGQ
jgi:cytochrome c oxidase cbb3-type subunit III